MAQIALMIPDLPNADAIVPFLRRIDEARWYTNFGPLVREFEQALAQQLSMGSAHGVVTTSNATVGIEMALQALRLPRNARVLVPALTFVATGTAVTRAGFEPVIADVDPATWLLTPEIATRALAHSRIDAVLPVATFGCPHNIAEWAAWRARHGVPVLIDAAGAFGNQPVGAVPAVFSLHATKSLGIGEGGFVASDDHEFIAHIRRMSNFGLNGGHGEVVEAGTNGKMSEYHAAVGLAALPRWRAKREVRRSLQAGYRLALDQHCAGVQWQDRPEGVPTLLVVALPRGVDAGNVAQRLACHGVQTRRWYCPPLHEHPAFAGCDTTGALDVSGDLSGRLLGLPFHLQLDSDDISTVCSELGAAVEEEMLNGTPVHLPVARPRASAWARRM